MTLYIDSCQPSQVTNLALKQTPSGMSASWNSPVIGKMPFTYELKYIYNNYIGKQFTAETSCIFGTFPAWSLLHVEVRPMSFCGVYGLAATADFLTGTQ